MKRRGTDRLKLRNKRRENGKREKEKIGREAAAAAAVGRRIPKRKGGEIG